ncbi:hypothetical protein [Halostagnicola bangensis]
MPDDDHRTDEPLERVLDSTGRRQQFAACVRDIPLLATVDDPRVVSVWLAPNPNRTEAGISPANSASMGEVRLEKNPFPDTAGCNYVKIVAPSGRRES